MIRFNTIRVRLTIWNSVVVLLLILLALIVSRQGIVYTLEHETRELLREELIELELAFKQLHPDYESIRNELSRKIESHSRHNWFSKLVNESGKTLWKSPNFPSHLDSIQFDAAKEFTFNEDHSRFVCTHTVQIENGPNLFIVLGEPTEFIKRDTWMITKVHLWIGLAMLVIGPIGGYLIANHSMKPVQKIINSTRNLNPTNLDERLELRGTQDELDQISAEINSFVELISHYISSQREFVANAAHELRSPLTAILTSVDVCLSKSRSNEDYKEQLWTVTEQCQFLRHLVNQLLELAEIEGSDSEELTKIDISELVHRSIAVFTGVAEESSIELDIHVQPGVLALGSSTRLIQVFNNLIDNAIKFTPAGGVVSIYLSRDETSAHFRITDDGPGVPFDKLEKIFDRFYQVDPARQNQSQRGNGLGLSICKAIVKAHRGTITAHQDDRGLTVEFQIPAIDDASAD